MDSRSIIIIIIIIIHNNKPRFHNSTAAFAGSGSKTRFVNREAKTRGWGVGIKKANTWLGQGSAWECCECRAGKAGQARHVGLPSARISHDLTSHCSLLPVHGRESLVTAFWRAQPDHLRGVKPSNALFLCLAKVEEIQEWQRDGNGLATRYRRTGSHWCHRPDG